MERFDRYEAKIVGRKPKKLSDTGVSGGGEKNNDKIFSNPH